MVYSSYHSYTNTYIQAVISCLSDHKVSENMAKIQESQLLRALEYFNLPDSMWPTGLYVRHTHGRTCDKLANQLMNTIKADFVKMAREEKCHAATIRRSYKLVYSDVSEETYLKDSVCSKGEKNLLMSSTLKSHLSELAVAECLGITLREEVSGLRVGRICQHTIIEVSVIV